MVWMKIGLKWEKSQKSRFQLSTYTRSTGPCFGRLSTLKLVKNQVPVIFLKMCTDSVPGRLDPVLVDWAHRKIQEIAET